MNLRQLIVANAPGARSEVGVVAPSFAVGAALCLTVAGAFWLGSAECRHWFMLPVLLCGILCSIDAVQWLRGRMDVFDPAALLALFGLHFFFFAPLLQVSCDFWVSDWLSIVTPLPDWRPWVGRMAMLNLGGLLVYRYVMTRLSCDRNQQAVRRKWVIDHAALPVLLMGGIVVAAGLQAWMYYRFGGISGYISAVENLQADAFRGWGMVCLFSESLPVLLAIAFAVYGRDIPAARSWTGLTCLAIGFLVLTLLCLGLRGSRSNTIWTLFLAVGLVHFWVRPIRKRVVLAGLAFLMVFMYGYGFYKWGGRDGVASLGNARSRSIWVDHTNRGAMRTLTFDMGRCGVQSLLLYSVVNAENYEYGFGRTYLGAASLVVPRSVFPNRPPTKRKEGTEALFGKGAYAPGRFEITWIYGLAGETMLNFGPLAVPFAFAILGLTTGYARRLMITLEPGDVRLLFLPLAVALCLMTLAWDSNNLVVFIAKNGVLPACIVLCATRRQASNQVARVDESYAEEVEWATANIIQTQANRR